MERETMLQRAINYGQSKGLTLIGITGGWVSTRKGSNARRIIDNAGVNPSDCVIYTGAHRQRKSEGWQLAVFAVR